MATSEPMRPEAWGQVVLVRGCRMLSVKDAAARLGLSVPQVRRRMGAGLLNCVKEGGRCFVFLDEVEAEARAIAAMRGGVRESEVRVSGNPGHGSFGAAAGGEFAGGARVSEGSEEACGGRDGGEYAGPDRWIRTREAAALLGLTYEMTTRLGKQGRVRRVVAVDPERPGDEAGGRRAAAWYSMHDVMRLAAERERREWERAQSHWEWQNRRHQPYYRRTIEAPPGDRLITPEEAAGLLGVARGVVRGLVREGRLFGWQRHPGRQGSPLWLSENQVRRYGEDSERLKRREAALEGMTTAPRRRCPPDWVEARGLRDVGGRGPSAHSTADYGDLYTSRQAAEALGISLQTLTKLRQRGRLAGVQRPRTRRHGGGPQWWFYRKADVHALMGDAQYAARSRRGKAIAGQAGGRPQMSQAEWDEWFRIYSECHRERPPLSELGRALDEPR